MGVGAQPSGHGGGPALRTPPAEMAVGFATVLRRAGLEVPVGSVVTYARALGAVGLADPSAVYWAGRATLVRRPEDLEAYDRCFAAWWGGLSVPARPAPPPPPPVTLAFDTDGDPGADAPEPDRPEGDVLTVRWSPREILRHKDFAAYTPDEHDEARRLMADLRLVGALRPSRRLRPHRRPRGRPDLRRTWVRRWPRSGRVPCVACWAAEASSRGGWRAPSSSSTT